MGTKERREREKAITRQRILDAARELFALHGYELVTMRKIAEAIEYSPTAIYLHFADKDALMRELSALDFEAFSQGFRAVPADLDPLVRLRGFAKVYVDFAVQHPHPYRLLFMSPCPPPVAAMPEHDDGTGAYGILRGVVQTCMATGAFHSGWTNADEIAQLFWTALHGVVSLHQVMEGRAKVEMLPVDRLVDRATCVLLTAMKSPPPTC